MPQRPGDPELTAEDPATHFQVEGDFRLVQRPSRLGRARVCCTACCGCARPSPIPALRRRRPALFAHPGDARRRPASRRCRSPPTITGPGPTICPRPPALRRTARHPRCLGLVLHSDYAAGRLSPRSASTRRRILVAHNGADAPAAALGKAAARAALGLPRGPRRSPSMPGGSTREKGLDQLLALADLRPGNPVPAGRLGRRGADRARRRRGRPMSGSRPGRRRPRCRPGCRPPTSCSFPPRARRSSASATACCR